MRRDLNLNHRHIFDQLTIWGLHTVFVVKPIFEELSLRVDFIQNRVSVIPLMSSENAYSPEFLQAT